MKRGRSEAERQREELATNVRHVAEQILPLTDSIESLTILLGHIWQNREELFGLLDGHSGDPVESHEREALPAETLFCTCCDATCSSLARALRAGWQCITDEEGNERGNYAGMCTACIAEEENAPPNHTENTPPPETKATKTPGMLF